MLKLVRSITAALAFSAATLSALAPAAAEQSCDRWVASVEQREEGKALTASVCAPGKDRDSVLEIVCHGNKVNIRYLVVINNDAEPKYQKQNFVFRAGNKRRRVFMTYEAMDGAFTAYLPRSHALFEMLMSGDEVDVAATRDKLRAPGFTLTGSRMAISRVISECR
jgi:hypothetical protein